MSSKCRTWDNDYFIEVHISKQPEEVDVIEAVGERSRKPLKDVSSLTLPKAALKGRAENAGVGRGQLLKERALSSFSRARRPGQRNMRTTHILNDMDNFPPLSRATTSSPGSSQTTLPVAESSVSRNNPPSFSEKCGHNTKTGTPGEGAAKSSIICKEDHIMADSDGSDIITIQNLPLEMVDKELLELLTPYGDVFMCCIERDSNFQSLGTAIVRMESRTACEWIINSYHGSEYPGAPGKLVCRFVIE